MIGILQGITDGQQFVAVLIIILIIGYFIYKEYPEFKKRISTKSVSDSTLTNRITDVEKRLDIHDEQLSRDYKKLNALEDSVELNRQISTQALEEMEILMRAMLGVLSSLEELGADGKTKQAQDEISAYLSKAAHRRPTA